MIMRPELLRTIAIVCGALLLTAGSAAAAGAGDVAHSAVGWVFRILNFLLVFAVVVYVSRRYGRRYFAARSAQVANTIAEAAQIRQQAEAELAAIEAIHTLDPDVMILDWDIPALSAPEMMRIIRSPGVFPKPNLPVIMVTDRGTRSRVQDAIRLGAHELLIKPMSPKALQHRLANIFLTQRPMVRTGKYYIPQPRRQIDWALIDAD